MMVDRKKVFLKVRSLIFMGGNLKSMVLELDDRDIIVIRFLLFFVKER